MHLHFDTASLEIFYINKGAPPIDKAGPLTPNPGSLAAICGPFVGRAGAVQAFGSRATLIRARRRL
ncbi:hypothetical protein XFLAVUS301_36520 [Xanthobacter flavus]|uniref:Uncharacterized protein n=1 Tax=Xanthobacter flavus TaxID=281 RepID=A0A9W6CU88_XANFL|nr:hypothetical protein XFLAVUS301_36520 [Xanthobacter flavus]